jgi:restriction system protein
MPIPDFQTIMLPLLKFLGDKKEHSLRETIEYLAEEFKLTEEERKELLPSGQQATFDNRVGWTRTYLKKAGLIESTKRAYFKISNRGMQVLKEKPKFINIKYLDQFPEFIEFRKRKKEKKERKPISDEAPPEELIESAYQILRDNLATELLQSVKNCSPSFFEKLVVDLLVKMGYGGTRKDAGQAIGRTGDGGIDGIIKEDRLGLDVLYIQAKRWENTVGRPEIQKFAGALQGQKAKKGIFITTSNFTHEAQNYVKNIESKIILIDADLLADFMIDHNIGVSPVASYELKRIDMDYFTED